MKGYVVTIETTYRRVSYVNCDQEMEALVEAGRRLSEGEGGMIRRVTTIRKATPDDDD